MILSVSRRTDIPNYYSEWFFNRVKEGFVYVRNPMNAHQVSKIDITPEVVDCIVFWTKNPEPMLNRLDELSSYDYYFQFTLSVLLSIRHFSGSGNGRRKKETKSSAGTIMLGLWYALMPWFAKIGIPAFLHAYFDFFSGAIQTYVFGMLTMVFVANRYE